ncbi:MAG: proprotein convertase P-domain-containing protein [Saprospiraceae bacterium]|nr:proprotein convertase P-domain-containing protein [Saprospiraceae bacterium]
MHRILLLFALLFPLLASAQSGGNTDLWKPEPPSAVQRETGERRIQPQAYQTFTLDLNTLRSRLAHTPMERTPAAENRAPIVEMPLPNGAIARFSVWESPIMEKGLAERYPGIRTYAGRALNDPTMTLRFDLTPQGFHAILFTQQHGTVFIDPLYQGQDRLYQVYAKKDFVAPTHKTFSCAFHEHPAGDHSDNAPQGGKRFGDCQLRTYRLALSCSGEYAQFHGGTVPLVLGAMVTTMNRVNGVYEREFAVRMNLVTNNDVLVFLDAETDPFTNDDVGAMLDQNQTIIDSLITTEKYDIGHVFGTGGGGVAGYGVVCNPGSKAIGVTGGGAPVGDPFDIDYVAHEIGHQFAGSHTFRGCGNDNENDPTALEPGSGSTIMAYAGICGDNVQSNSNDYFHGYNLEEMSNFITFGGGNTCGERIPLDNMPPEATNSGQAYIIPLGTPFFLTAEATDPDGDTLTYCWEQFDDELSPQPPQPDNAGGPNFRTLSPSLSPTRYFPALTALVNDGPFTWEVLPTVARDMNFRVSVRDNAIGGGCTDHAGVAVTVSDLAGPFVVTNPDTDGIRWTAGGQEMVYWNVANTQLAPVSCSEVDILLSTDGGLSYPVVLAAGVANNGSYAVDVPDLNTTSARVMVVCAGNIFFDISNNNFSIEAPALGFVLHTEPNAVSSCGLNELSIALNVDTTGGFDGLVGLEFSGLPEGVGAAFDQDTIGAGGQAMLTLSGLAAAAPGLYTIVLTGTGNGGSQSASFVLHATPALPDPVALVAPLDGAVNAQLRPLLAWNLPPRADTYTLQIADNPEFSPVLFQQSGLSVNQYRTPENLPDGDTLYWRVQARNTCGEGAFGPVYQFSTAAVVCTTLMSADLPLAINPNDTASIFATVMFPVPGVVTDVNIPVLKGTHDWINDLRFSLISPSGTTSELLGPICWDEDNFDIRFDDQAAAAYNAIPCPPTDGEIYQPRSPLSAFNGQDPLGVWTLRVFDAWAADGGELTNWSLEVCYLPPPNAGCALSAAATVTATNCTPCATDLALTVSGAAGQAAYLWSDGSLEPSRSGVCEGNYTVTVVDSASCEVTLQIAVPPATEFLTVGATATPAQDANNGSATATAVGGIAPLSYLWNTGDTTATVQQLAPGTYTVTVTDANGCTATTEVVVDFVSGLGEIIGLNEFRLMPNPTGGRLQAVIAFDEDEDAVVELYTAGGQRLQRMLQRGQRIELLFDLTDQNDGVYFISVRTARGSVTKPVVLAR